jgi:para-nitrobenzyl esterase
MNPRILRRAVAPALLTAALLAPGRGRASAQQPCAKLAGGATACGMLDTASTPGSPVAQVWRGLRYANAPRWQPPTPYSATSGTITATKFQPACMQPGPAPKETYAEDCFFLNVWAPRNATATSALPVMVFIHGGAFVIGRGSSPLYQGAYIAQSDTVIVVTLNYRLGSLGFLANSESRIPPNLGLMDQQAAMQWVRRNIRGFGGDPGRVTIFGESAGAMSVGLHLFSVPSSDSLFTAAIMESNPMGVVYHDSSQANSDGRSFAKDLCHFYRGVLCDAPGASDLWFRANYAKARIDTVMMAEAVYDSSTTRVALGGLPQALPWAPAVDGSFVVNQPVAGVRASGIHAKPYVFGMNHDEGLLFAGIADTLVKKWEYGLLVDRFFGLDAGKVTAYTASGAHPYRADGHASIAGLSQQGSALDELINDLVFNCGNLASANTALQADTVYAYRFTQSPVPFDMWGAKSPCTTSLGVCHGYELPYVFNTLAAADTTNGNTATPTPTDWQLAAAMAQAWGSFAKTHTFANVAWTPYTTNGAFYDWRGATTGMTSGLAASANCTGLWYGIYPLARYSPGSKTGASGGM